MSQQRCGEYFDLEENLKKREHCNNPPPPEWAQHALAKFWEEFNRTSAPTVQKSECGLASYQQQQKSNGCAETKSSTGPVTIQQSCGNETIKVAEQAIITVDKYNDIPFSETNPADEILSDCCTEADGPGMIVPVKDFHGGPASAAASDDMSTRTNSESIIGKENNDATVLLNQKNPMDKLQEREQEPKTREVQDDGPQTTQRTNVDGQWVLKDFGDSKPINPVQNPVLTTQQEADRSNGLDTQIGKLQEQERNMRDLGDKPTTSCASYRTTREVQDGGPRAAQSNDQQWDLRDSNNPVERGGSGPSEILNANNCLFMPTISTAKIPMTDNSKLTSANTNCSAITITAQETEMITPDEFRRAINASKL